MLFCKCPARMRKYVLPYFGYELLDGVWWQPGKQDIPDRDLESNHASLTAKIVTDFGLEKAKGLLAALYRGEPTEKMGDYGFPAEGQG